MWTDPLPRIVLLALALGVTTPAPGQQPGQYRSRILLDPVGELGRGSELSAEELEQQIDGIREPYARSSATRHLARHYLQQGDYPAAIGWYREALAADGLSDVANREMLRELAQVYLLAEQYPEAIATLEQALAIPLQPEAGDFLMLAQANYRLGDYVAVVAALDRLQASGLVLEETGQLRQALALYYRAGAFAQCATILRQLIDRDPREPSYWHQLASVHLQQNQRRQARDRLVLARDQGIPFTGPELTLLVDLQAVTGNPYGAASLLQEAMASGELPRDAANQRKLFELWLQAQERERAMEALASAAELGGDTELYLYLAQLQMEDADWDGMQQSVLASCTRQLPDRFVSRANLLLGVSLLKQGQEPAARRALINATLIGGAQDQAAEWLRYMGAAPTTEAEARRVVGPCVGSEGKRASLASGDAERPAPAASREAETPAGAAPDPAGEAIAIKSVERQRFYYVEQDGPLADLAASLSPLAARLNVTLVKAGGSADGPLQILLQPGSPPQVGLPVKGVVRASGRYRLRDAPEFRCAWRWLGPGADLPAEVAAFSQQVEAAGHQLSGESRLVIQGGPSPGLELQLGIR